MGKKHKLLETDTMIDRFTALPDEVALHILSSLNLLDLTRVGAVSKRCYQFYLLTPSFGFLRCHDNMKIKSDKMNCFDQFLRRRGNNKMHRFSIDLCLPKSLSSKVSQVMSWIDTAATCSVEVLDLYLNMLSSQGNLIGLPSSIFRYGSLRSLLVKMEEMFKVPSFPCPNNIQSLELTYVKLEEGFSTWVSNSCKCIKEIKLDSVHAENITIESSSLESFTFEAWSHLCSLKISGEKLESIHIKWKIYEPGSRSLHVYAPNLKYLKWNGDLLSEQNLGDLLCLERAELKLEAQLDSVYDFHNIFELLCSICRVKTLILSDRTIQICNLHSIHILF